ncbi:hypothetical protein ABZP36_035575 [Zizania latifolia]
MASSRQQRLLLAVLAVLFAAVVLTGAARPEPAERRVGSGVEAAPEVTVVHPAVAEKASETVAMLVARPEPAERSGGSGVEAAPEDTVVHPAILEKARETVEMLMARLPAGPSPKGPGH